MIDVMFKLKTNLVGTLCFFNEDAFQKTLKYAEEKEAQEDVARVKVAVILQDYINKNTLKKEEID